MVKALFFLPLLASVASALTFRSSFLGRHGHGSQNAVVDSRRSTMLCMKTIAVFGASGLTASECVYQALKNGDTVVGLTRYVNAVDLDCSSIGHRLTTNNKPLLN
jgi:hypothetical protein